MLLQNGRFTSLPFLIADWTGGQITPELVVLHDTASRLQHGAAARYLAKNDRKVSAHFVIERTGEITQLVPTDRRANHAGASEWNGRRNCNGFSIGIEIVNPGRMDHVGDSGLAWFGELFDIDGWDLVERTTPQHGPGLWMPYTPEQIAAVEALLAALFDQIDTLVDIQPHWYISPGRKIDTNPLFPLAAVRSRLFGRDDPADNAADDAASPVGEDEFVQIATMNSGLNLRRWPSFNPNVLTTIPAETVVPVIARGTFDGRSWLKVFFDGHAGWVVEQYTDPITWRQI